MRRDLFKITKEEKNRIKNLHETVKHNPTIDSTLVLNEHQANNPHRHSNPNACSNMTCCDNNGDGYCPAGTLKSCPNTGYAWNGRSCVSNKKSSQGCCDCRQTNPQPYPPTGGGGCPEIVGVVTAMGGSCREACRDFAPNLQSIKKPTQHSPTDPNEKESGLNERTYELPIRYGKKRMSESQLVKMLRRISEEQELNEIGYGTACTANSSGGSDDCVDSGGNDYGPCSGGTCGDENMATDKPVRTKVKTKGGSNVKPTSRGEKVRGEKLKERTLTNIVRKVMFEMEELNEVKACPGAGCKTCCDNTDGWSGCGDCSGHGPYTDKIVADGPGKTKGVKGGSKAKPSSRGEKSKRYGPSDDIHVQFPDYGIPGMFEERLSGIVRNVMSEMKMR